MQQIELIDNLNWSLTIAVFFLAAFVSFVLLFLFGFSRYWKYLIKAMIQEIKEEVWEDENAE